MLARGGIRWESDDSQERHDDWIGSVRPAFLAMQNPNTWRPDAVEHWRSLSDTVAAFAGAVEGIEVEHAERREAR